MPGIPGDPAAVEAAADQLAAAGGEFTEARDSITAHARSTTAEWTGLASMMAFAALEEYGSKALVGAEVCRAAAPVLRTFAAQLRTAQQQYADGQAWLAEWQAQIDQAAAGQIDALVGQLAEMQGSDPNVLGDETGPQPPPPPPKDDGWSLSDIGHGILDVAGLVPLIGEPADGIPSWPRWTSS